MACMLAQARLALFSVALLSAGAATLAGAATTLRALDLVGRPVLDAGGAEAGTVTDLFVDPAGHRIAALALDLQGRERVCAAEKIGFAGADAAPEPRPLRVPEGCEQRGGMAAAPQWRRASDITKAKVHDRDDAVVGEVKDLFVDPATGRVTHVLVDFVPAWFASEGWAAVPIASLRPQGAGYLAAFDPEALRPAAASKRPAPPPPRAKVDARLSKLLGRSVVDPEGHVLGRVTGLGLDLQRNVIATARVEAGGTKIECVVGPRGLSLSEEAFGAPAAPLSAQPGCGPGALASAPALMRARELLAAGIRDEGGESVGRLRDVVVSLGTAKLHYLVADFDSGWVRDGDLVALPLRPVEREDGRPFVRAALMELQKRPLFPEKRLADVGAPAFAEGVHRYLYGG